MKFQTVYMLFNAVIVVSFLFIFLLPLALLGPDYFRLFAQRNWIAGLLFAATLIIINGYFFFNWKLFRLLEREDWPELISLLERRTARPWGLRKSYCRMLLNACLITADTARIGALEARVREKKPRLLRSLAVQFGLPYLLQKDPQAAERYFRPLAGEAGVADRGWLRWNLAFSLMQQKRYAEAKDELAGLLTESPEPVLRLLALYMLDSYADSHPEVREALQQGREELRRLYSPEQWTRKLEKAGENPQTALLAPVLRSAREWLWA